jgi:hypothetical protein
MIVALMESLKGRPDLMSRSQMSHSLKLTKQETQEQSVSSFVVRIMELKGKCAFGPFLSILVIECKHKCLNVKICPKMIKVQITS